MASTGERAARMAQLAALIAREQRLTHVEPRGQLNLSHPAPVSKDGETSSDHGLVARGDVLSSSWHLLLLVLGSIHGLLESS